MLHDKNGAAVAICVDVSDGMDKSIAGIAELASEANEIARDLEKVLDHAIQQQLQDLLS